MHLVILTHACATEDADIYFTTDGADASEQSMAYMGPFEITQTSTIKAVAIKDGHRSSQATATYTIIIPDDPDDPDPDDPDPDDPDNPDPDNPDNPDDPDNPDSINSVMKSLSGQRVIYNLRGQRVTNPTKGLYIIDGKKVVIP